jgi:hypothetical protein
MGIKPVKINTSEKSVVFVYEDERWVMPLETEVSIPRVGENVHLPDEDVKLRSYKVIGVDYFYRKVPHDPWRHVAPLDVQVRLKKEESSVSQF